MAMFLKLEASEPGRAPRSSRRPASRTSWTGTRSPSCPCFWVPFKSRCRSRCSRSSSCRRSLAFIVGYAMFKRRVGGVYFAIITQALAADPDDPDHRPAGLHRRDQRHHRPAGRCSAGTSAPTARKYILYFVNALPAARLHPARRAACCEQARHACWSRCATTRTACASPATTSRNFKTFIFCLGRGAVAAIGGAMFTLQVGFMSPSLRRHRAVDRDGDLLRRRRAACRWSARCTATLLVNCGKTYLLRERSRSSGSS